jgi:hypothetical protein
MTNEQINITIEENIRPALHGNIYRPPCDFCNDLNAMHEAEKKMSDEQKEIYFLDLMCLYGKWPKSIQAIQATAKERAETFLRTLGKWEEQ